ncbi:hypothetical protein PUG42_14660 [Erwiniaceae bacterium L1_54_3]|uniref:hypothetical protein n=1 Tax=Candidatus Pantoea formicae TaxID=2608355 RepID=UPI0014238794|nr:hypothetical protein [Pantoea formicae]MDF7649794.1 hypothetical protein [Erwiniaceae bacterium L1_54_3]
MSVKHVVIAQSGAAQGLAVQVITQSGAALGLAVQVITQSGTALRLAVQVIAQSGAAQGLAVQVTAQSGAAQGLAVKVITQSGAALGLAVLAPLTRYLHFTRPPDGPVQTGLSLSRLHLSPASMLALLVSSFRSALRNAIPRAAPACLLTSVYAVGEGTMVKTLALLLLQSALCLRPHRP